MVHFFEKKCRVVLVPFQKKLQPSALPNNLPPPPNFHTKIGSAEQRSCLGGGGRAAGQRQWQCWGVAGGASVDVGSGGAGRWGEQRRSHRLACVGVGPLTDVCSGGGTRRGGEDIGACFAWLALGSGSARLWPRAEIRGGQRRSPAAMAEKGQQRLLWSACVGVRPLTRFKKLQHSFFVKYGRE